MIHGSTAVQATLLALALAFPWAAGAQEQLVIGKGQVWARSIRPDRQPGPVHDGKRPAPPLYFWMTYHGNEEALRRMQDKGSLPIRHRWSVVVGGDTSVEPPDSEYIEQRSIALKVGSADRQVQQALAGELQAQDRFTWRTWSKKESVSPGFWRVDVLYDDLDDTPVTCDIGGRLQPCSFTLHVR